MKRFLGLSLFFSGLVLFFFTSNIVLYSHSKDYRDALREAVTGREDEDIPVVDISRDVIISYDEDKVIYRELENKELPEDEVPLAAAYVGSNTDESIQDKDACASESNESGKESLKEPVIVDKEYHEDCGSGEGYWLIKYEDGTTAIEQ
ncbi:MAG: hypothetical protein E7306_00545 [Butyrivibrio sp.]|nr:hypothetical protein [Butyrivibrio sp.]